MYATDILNDERALVLRLIGGDEDAFCELYAAYKKRKHPLLANIGNTIRCRILSHLESINQFPSQNMPVQITFVLITIEHISHPA